MDSLRRFHALVRADLLQRLRSSRCRLVLAIVAALTWACFPPNGAGYMILGINGGYRGAYSSAWIGMVLAMLTVWMALLGFYVVRGTIRLDLDTRVWELLETSVLSRPAYLLAKWSSHMAVLGLFLAVQLLVGMLAQWVRAEDRAFDLVELVKPMLLLGLPSIALTAACAVCFDLVPWLRHTAGNVAYFGVWLATVILAVVALQALPGTAAPGWDDPRGIATFYRAAERQLGPQLGLQQGSQPGPQLENRIRVCLGCGMQGRQARTVAWHHWQVEAGTVTGRLAWLGLAVAAVLLCHPLMDRAAARLRQGERAAAVRAGGRPLAWLARLLAPLRRTAFGTLVAAELELELRRRPPWWWCALALAAAGALLAPAALAALSMVVAWALMTGMFARAGLRESEHGTAAIVFCLPGTVQNILLARWVALLMLAWLPLAPALVRLAATAPLAALAALAAGMSLATWALALAALSRRPHAYELLACVLVYLGLNGAPVLDVGTAPATTLAMHALALPLAGALLWPAWRAASGTGVHPLAALTARLWRRT